MVKSERELTIFKDGQCTLPVVETLTGNCLSNIKKFPNDVHNCTFNFYTSNVDNTIGYIDYQIYKNNDIAINGAWSVQSMYVCKLNSFVASTCGLKVNDKIFLIFVYFITVCFIFYNF